MSTLAVPAPRSAAPLPIWAALYVALVNALGLAAILPVLALLPDANVGIIAAWSGACLAGELLNMPTPTRRGQISMATSFHLAMALVLSPVEFLPVVWISRLAVKGLIQRQAWYRAMFNAAQVAVSVCVAWLLWRSIQPAGLNSLAGGDAGSIGGAAGASPGFLAAAFGYYIANTFSVSGIIALTGGGRLLDAWRINYGYPVEILGTVALLLLAPAVASSVAVFGPAGLALLVAPVAAMHAAGHSFRRQEERQQERIAAERLAAKSELSTQVGFEMTEALTTISGNIQLLDRHWPNVGEAEFKRRVEEIRRTSDRISVLSRGLTEFSRGGFAPDWIDPATVIGRSLAFLKTEGRLAHVRVETVLDREIREVFVDAPQMQQALINLLRNSAAALEAARTNPGWIWIRVRRDRRRQAVEFVIEDNGPGLPAGSEWQVFEPGFTRQPGRSGFGLSTVHRIVRNHDGTVEASTRPGGGARIGIVLPAPAHRRASSDQSSEARPPLHMP
ncbi:MAG TPA: ATP-binding protein [Candidatus Eisenbacteria bacterium]